jgi:hypothetical protein
MKKSGRKTPQQDGKNLKHRDELWDKINTFPEGTLFKAKSILENLDSDYASNFNDMKNHDYVHVCDGWLTPIVETKNLRRLPRATIIAHKWAERFSDTLVEFGDWSALKNGIYPWEPIEGYRFRSEKKETQATLSLGYMKIRIYAGPDWLKEDTPENVLLRSINDMPIKSLGGDLFKWLTRGQGINEKEKLFKKTEELAASLDAQWEITDEAIRDRRPTEIMTMAKEAISRERERLK